MAEIYSTGIPVVEPPDIGVHLIWLGPGGFLFSPGGWRIERRESPQRIPDSCEVVTRAQIKASDEVRLAAGVVSAKQGLWPGADGGACEIWTVEFDEPTGGVHGTITGPQAVLCGLRNGKAAAFAGPLSGNFDLGADPIDTLVIYVRFLFTADGSLRLCRYDYAKAEFPNAKLLATLQLPIRELMPTLTGTDAEYAEAQRRLRPGESIDKHRFADFASLLRGLSKTGPARPIDKTLLIRTRPDDDFDEMGLLDPIRMVYSSPLWRRALGLSFFDNDPSLVPNQTYQYRITGFFPGDAAAPVYGFHTIPSGATVPADFYLHDCHVRLPAPAVVQRAPGFEQTGLTVVTRRGIPLQPRSTTPWLDALLEQYSAVIELPTPATQVAFDLEPGHQLTVEGGVAWGMFSSAVPVPAGPTPVVTFAQPVSQLRLAGKGFLFAIRPLDSPPTLDLQPVSVILPAVTLANTPRPAPPLSAQASNLQAAAHLMTQTQLRPPPRHLLGFDLRWEPAVATGLAVWPSQGLSPPPLDETTFQVERRPEPAGAWTPLLEGDNIVLGSRDEPTRDTAARPGCDMMACYPEVLSPSGSTGTFTYRDVFMRANPQDPNGPKTPQPPPPSTILRYRVRAVDVIGRPSATWVETGPVRLEKHEPPPLPAAPDETPADALPDPAPTGVHAKVLVRDAEGLTPDELDLLGTSDNVIVLRWGWHAKQRKLDPYATHFRLYIGPPLDDVSGTLLSATADPARPGVFHAHLQLSRAVQADTAKGLYLDAGYAFYIEGHGAGTDLQATVRTTIAAPGGGFRSPALGALHLPLKYSPRLTRPGGWPERLAPAPGEAFVPITGSETYQAIIRDRLTLTADYPSDVLWVGVSSADDQAYVADTFHNVSPSGALPGNESAVVAVLCQAKRRTKPDLQIAPSLDPVPRIRTPEPVNGPVAFRLDLGPYLSGLPASGLLKPERLYATDLLSSLDVEGTALFARPINPRAGEMRQPVSFANPDDQSAVAAALAAGALDDVDDRFLVALSHMHPWRDRLFAAVTNDPVSGTAFDETLPSGSGRYVYRMRIADAAGLLSVEGAIAHVVVRVPSMVPGPIPVLETRRVDDPPASLRFRIPPNKRLFHALLFRLVLDEQNAGARGTLLRVPDRPDLPPGDGVRMQLDSNSVLRPSVVDLSTVERDGEGWALRVEPEAPQTGPVRLWLCTLTDDGMPSQPSGPWSIGFTAPPPPAPVLSGAATPSGIRLDWTWPPDGASMVTVERSVDSATWQRISPPLAKGDHSYETARAGRYRLKVAGPRGVFSNVVEV